MLSTKEFYQNVTDRKLIFFNQRNIIVSDRLFMLCNEICSPKMMRTKPHELSALLECTIDCIIMT